MNNSSPSFKEIEFTIGLPWTHLSPASITDHLEESIIIGTLEISGSEAIKFKNFTMAFSASNMPSSILMSIICAPFSTCCLATTTASSYCSSMISLAKALDPVTLVLSPTLINNSESPITIGSSPDRRILLSIFGTNLGRHAFKLSAIAAICSGVVPQQPPATFTKPLSANSFNKPEVSSGFSSNPVSDIGFGRPALG